MRTIAIVFVFIFIFSCKKTQTIPPSSPLNPTPSNTYWWKFIPNWYNGDTLVGDIFKQDAPGEIPYRSGHDTIYTFTNKDTSYILHHGIKYYVWTAKYFLNTSADTFIPNDAFYTNVYINTKIDTTNAFTQGLFSQADPYKYFDGNSWSYHRQRLNVDNNPNSPFTAQNPLLDSTGTYWGLNVKK